MQYAGTETTFVLTLSTFIAENDEPEEDEEQDDEP